MASHPQLLLFLKSTPRGMPLTNKPHACQWRDQSIAPGPLRHGNLEFEITFVRCIGCIKPRGEWPHFQTIRTPYPIHGPSSVLDVPSTLSSRWSDLTGPRACQCRYQGIALVSARVRPCGTRPSGSLSVLLSLFERAYCVGRAATPPRPRSRSTSLPEFLLGTCVCFDLS